MTFKHKLVAWLKYATGRWLPFTIKRYDREGKKNLSLAYKLGYGDYVWNRMGKPFNFKGIPLEDRLKDRSVLHSDFFGNDAQFRMPTYKRF